MTYLAKWVSEVKEGHTITAADVEVLARVQQCILAADKHHQQARDAQRDAQANVAEKLVVSRAVEFVDAVTLYDDPGVLLDAHIELRAAVANLLAVEAAS